MLELLATSRNETVGHAFNDLRIRGLVDMKSGSESQVLADYDRRRKLQLLIKNKSNDLRNGVPGSFLAILDRWSCRFQVGDTHRLIPYAIPLQKRDIEEAGIPFCELARDTLRWWRRYMAVALPVYELTDVVGFHLITDKGHQYLPMTTRMAVGSSFSTVPSISDEITFVVDNPIAALRMTIWSIMDRKQPLGFVCPQGMRDNAEVYSSRRTVFWSVNNDTNWYLRALNTVAAQTLDPTTLGNYNPEVEYPCHGSLPVLLAKARQAPCAHKAAANHLLSLRENDARSQLVGLTLDPADQASLLSYANGADGRRLKAILDDSIQIQTIHWDGSVIADTPEGWVADGKLICSAKINIEETRAQGDTGDAIMTGTVVYQGQSYPFKTKLSIMRKKTADWLIGFLVSKGASIAYVKSGWSNKLIAIAQQFHPPTPVLADQLYGWSDGKLRMPCFTVDENNVYTTPTIVSGPMVMLPSILSAGEWDAFKSPAFCRVVLAMMGNLIRTSQDLSGIGIMLTNEPHVVERLASAFSSPMQTHLEPDYIDEHRKDPLPTFASPNEHNFFQLFGELGYKHTVVSVDSHSARLSVLSSDWLQLKVGDSLDYGALRVIFRLMSDVLRSGHIDSLGEAFYRVVADIIGGPVSEQCSKHRLAEAAMDLDMYYTCRQATMGSRVVQLIAYGTNRGDIHPEVTEADVIIKHSDYTRLVGKTTMQLPDVERVTKALRDSNFLSAEPAGAWHISRLSWDFLGSLSNSAV